MSKPAMTSWLIFLASAAVSAVFFINLCDLIYGCGCESWWAGVDAHCNVHHASPPHCPWCKHGTTIFPFLFTGIFGSQYVFSFRMRQWPWYLKLAASMAAFPVVGTIVGFVAGWATGYWK